MIMRPVDDVDVRLAEDEWKYLQRVYSSVAFNHSPGKPNSKRHLFVGEPEIMLPNNWNFDVIKTYDSYICFNDQFINEVAENCPSTKTYFVSGCLGCNGYYWLDDFVPYDSKIPGILILNKLYSTGRNGDICNYRQKMVNAIGYNPRLPVHIWSTLKWGGNCYKGAVESPFHHSHLNHIKKISEYRFCACFESTYHPMWSRGFITERLFNCFKAKTVAIYIGCYNIESYVPNHLFVDFRSYYKPSGEPDWERMLDRLNSMSKQEYTDMTEAAFEWQKTNRIGNIQDLEVMIKEAIGNCK